MKKMRILFVLTVIAAIILTACTNQYAVKTDDLVTKKSASSLVGNTEKSTVLESTSVTEESKSEENESTTQKSTESTTTEKATTTANQTTTTTKQSTTAKPTTTKASTTTTTKRVTTTQKPSTTHKQTTTKKTATTTTKKSSCTNNNNHSMSCGNMGKWYSSRSELKNDYMRVSDYWLAKLDDGEIDWDTYMKNCPQGYECWSCADCGKWTGNYK